jgi:hypothetical protein
MLRGFRAKSTHMIVQLLLFIAVIALSACQSLPASTHRPSREENIRELVEILLHADEYVSLKGDELNKIMAKLNVSLGDGLESKLGRLLSDGERGKFVAIVRNAFDRSFDEALSEQLRQFYQADYDSTEIEEMLRFYQSSAGQKMLRMQFLKRLKSEEVSADMKKSFLGKFLSQFNTDLKREAPQFHAVLFPSPPQPLSGWNQRCPPMTRALLGECLELSKPR